MVQLTDLVGVTLNPPGAAGDMLWIQFGDLSEVPLRKGGTKWVGQFALHLQCPWRFTHNGSILSGSQDFYYTAQVGSGASLDSTDDTVFRLSSAALSKLIQSLSPAVIRVSEGQAGAFELSFSGGLVLAVMPVISDPSVGESWRLFKPGADAAHLIYPSNP